MSWILSVKALLISMVVLLMGLAMKVSVPLATEFLGSHVPVMWSSFLTWLRPPYLYVIVNCIIITIAASSRLHHHHEPVEDRPSNPKIVSDPGTGRYEEEKVVSREFKGLEQVRAVVVYEQREEAVEVAREAEPVDKYENDHYEGADDEEVLVSRSPPRMTTPPRRSDSPELFFSPVEEPLVSARFGHRKPVKPVFEGGQSSSLKVSKPNRHETMENTWKMITEGRSMPLSRRMKKCETLENHGRHVNVSELDQPSPLVMKKSKTFKDRTNQPMPPHDHLTYSPPASTGNYKLRKEPSLSQDELNKRVEAFIRKFNEEMRLQRQESLNQYKEMINRGSH